MISWGKSIELQDELRAWWRTDLARNVADQWFKASKKVSPLMREAIENRERAFTPGPGLPRFEEHANFSEIQQSAMEHGDLYWISGNMMALIEAATPRMPDQVFRRDDLPSEVGFAVFARPFVYHDLRGKAMPVSAMSWRPVVDPSNDRSGVVVAHYNELGSLEWQKEITNPERFPSLLLSHVEIYIYGEAIIPIGFPHEMPDHANESKEVQDALRECVRLQRKVPMAIWTLMGQPLAVVEKRRPERATRRRLEKDSSPLAVSTIRVVDLRRIVEKKEGGDGGTVEVEWTHQWIVSGHWRNQWVPSKATHRVVWINAYLKGPPDKPIVIKKTVHRLVR